jgi:hypothetical protein
VSAFICVLTLGMLIGPGSEVVAYEPVYRTEGGTVWILGHYPVRLLVLGPAGEPGWLLGRNVGGRTGTGTTTFTTPGCTPFAPVLFAGRTS